MNPLIAVDVGNSRIKLGWYDVTVADAYADPVRTLQLAVEPWDPQPLADWLRPVAGAGASSAKVQPVWCIASVHRAAAARLSAWVHGLDDRARVQELFSNDLPLTIAVASPNSVGMDRLLAALAVNRLRSSARPAIVVDLGSAITVDVVSDRGAFVGGSILPGIAMSARAIAEQTDRLPHLAFDELGDPPPALGTSTQAAIRAGLFWGAIGAMRELVAQLSADLSTMPQLFLTGGAGPPVARLLGRETRYVAHLVLGGIALAHASNKP